MPNDQRTADGAAVPWDGVPPNPEVTGWHWLAFSADSEPLPLRWAKEGWWMGLADGSVSTVKERWTYLSPVPPPPAPSPDRLVAEAREKALRETIDVCRRLADKVAPSDGDIAAGWANGCDDCERAILALLATPADGGGA